MRRTYRPFRNVLTFTKNVDGSMYVSHHPSIRFFISGGRAYAEFAVQPLTLTRFVRAIIGNLIHLNYWKLMRVLVWRFHAFEVEENVKISWAKFKPFLRFKKLFSKSKENSENHALRT